MKYPTKPVDPDYRGVHLQPLRSEKERKHNWNHRIYLFRTDKGDIEDIRKRLDDRLLQVVNVYEHTIDDFEFNARKIIKHYQRSYGDINTAIFTIGQTIRFRVHKDQKEPFELPLFAFLVNYTMLILPVELGLDLTNWKPWLPMRCSSSEWCKQIDRYVESARPYANMRKICECLEWSKYLMNLWCDSAGDRLAISISNNDFMEVMQRSTDAYESITCSFDISEDITPSELEALTMTRTERLINFIAEQGDLSLSVYAKNGLLNPTQFREYAVHICHKPNLDGTTVPYTYPTNIIMGINDVRAFSVDAHGGRKAEITKLNVSDAGTLERALMMLMSPVRFVDLDWECDSRHFRSRLINGRTDLEKLNGRVYTLDPNSDEFRMLDPREDTDLIGKMIYLKTPITCTHPRRREGYICSACYGKLMANLNCDLHIGRVAAAESADEIEQKLLSAKHALKTDTVSIKFDDTFYQYFDLGNGQIVLNADMVDPRNSEELQHLSLEFYPAAMKKNQDGESRHFDRSFDEIVVVDDRDDSRTAISERNGSPLYLSPEFNDNNFLPALRIRDSKDVIRIPFSDLVDTGEVMTSVLFEYSYKNNELASPLLRLEQIMFSCTTIGAFDTYDECLNEVMPLFMKGGIHIPDYQTELLVSQLIISPDGSPVDWNDPNPEYVFQSINKSIQANPAALTSVLYRESGQQLAGAYNTYEKTAPDSYASFVIETDKL